MKIYLKLIIVFLILFLVAGSMLELVYASIDQDCSCCNNKCQDAKKCHENLPKVCLCSYKILTKACLFKSISLSGLLFSGFFVQRLRFTYAYLSMVDVFHPPKSQVL